MLFDGYKTQKIEILLESMAGQADGANGGKALDAMREKLHGIAEFFLAGGGVRKRRSRRTRRSRWRR